MSETSFSVNDLLRRKLQTALAVISLALSVASTLFLLLFAQKIGFGVLLMTQSKMTSGFSALYSPFVLFLAALILVAGGVMVSFMVSLMMSQRTRDIGLIKAVGCPNDLVFGYFFAELLIVTLLGCLLGVFLGWAADSASSVLLSSMGFQVGQASFNLPLVLAVFVLFLGLALVVGVKPILDTSRIEPAKAISPERYLGLTKESAFSPLSRSRLTLRLAVRNLVRRRSTTIKIVVCLSTVFTLVTVGVAGGIIADQTTRSWVERATGSNVILIGHPDICNQYTFLEKEFSAGSADIEFNYTRENYFVPTGLLNELSLLGENLRIDARLILKTSAEEVQGILYGDTTGQTRTVGDDHNEDAVVIGVDPAKVISNWFLRGNFLNASQAWEAVVGDTLSRMFSEPLVQGVKVFGRNFDVIGVCIDPISNGRVLYVPLKSLQNATGLSGSNAVFLKIEGASDQQRLLDQVKSIVVASNPDFSVLEVNGVLDENLDFLGYIWSSVMLLPLFSLAAASLCLLGYVILTIDEQRQELGVLRAIGARPRAVVSLVSGQSMLVLLSSYAVGTAFGIIITLLILIREPSLTQFDVLNIAGWLTVALILTFIASLYPALRFAGKPLMEVMRPA